MKGPPGVRFKQFESREDALNFARQDAALLGFADAMTHPEKDLSAASATEGDSYRQAMEKAGFRPSGMDFYGKQEHELKVETGDGGIFELRIFQRVKSACVFSMKKTISSTVREPSMPLLIRSRKLWIMPAPIRKWRKRKTSPSLLCRRLSPCE